MSTYDFDSGPTQQDVEAMQAELAQRRLADWQREAVTAHPGAAPFADLLTAGTKEAVMELAADIANRHQPQPQQRQEWEPERQSQRQEPAFSTPAASPSLEGYGQQVDDQEYQAEIRRLRDNPGTSWKTYLDMKFARAMDGQAG